MHYWMAMVGNTDRAIVLLPVLLGALTVPVVFWVGSRVFSVRAGLLAAAIFSVAPLAVLSSVYVRPYSLLPLCCLLSVFFLGEGLRGGRGILPWLGHASATLVLLLTHHWTWLVWGAEWCIAASWLVAGPLIGVPRPGRKAVLGWIFAQISITAGYAFWLPAFIHQSRHAGYDAAFNELSSLFQKIGELSIMQLGWYALPAVTALVAAAVCRRVYIGWPREPGRAAEDEPIGFLLFAGVPLVASAAAFVLSRKTNLVIPHTMTTIAPCLLLTISQIVCTLSISRPRLVAAVAGTLIVVVSIRQDVRTKVFKSNAREAAKIVSANFAPNDVVLVLPQWDASSFYYYFGSIDRGSHYPVEDFSGPFHYDDTRLKILDQGPALALARKLERAHDEGKRVWFVFEKSRDVEIVPRLEEPLSSLDAEDYSNVGHIRTAQFERVLYNLYGKPKLFDPMPKRMNRVFDSEVLQTVLFDFRPRNDQVERDEPGPSFATGAYARRSRR